MLHIFLSLFFDRFVLFLCIFYYLSKTLLHNFLCLLPVTFSFKPFFSFSLTPFYPAIVSVSLSLSFSRSQGYFRVPPENECRSQHRPSLGVHLWLIPASDLRIVHPIAHLFPRGSHWYQDPDIRITGVPRSPFTFPPRRTRVKCTISP